MNGKQKEFLAKSGINLTDGLVYFSENLKNCKTREPKV
mgnify:CR=1 FL=1